MRLNIFSPNRTVLEIVGAIFVAMTMFGIGEYVWFSFPQPDSSIRFVQNALSIPFIYKLANAGDGKRNLMLRTALWLTPVLLIQVLFQLFMPHGFDLTR